ncbi:MAG TPA: HAMP domain-containing sensor histidine kinase [Acidimicrobiales bacterium]|jgi:two-component system sensor histidine kinase MprB|nr:HAMP domain-containing sensor histidine kinase [Acidimicrobiales bacterium]
MTAPSAILSKYRRIGFRARLGTFIALAVGLTVALGAVVSFFVVRNQLYSQLDNSLKAELPTGPINLQSEGAQLAHSGSGFVQLILSNGTPFDNSLHEEFGSPYLTPTPTQVAVATSTSSVYRFDTVRYNDSTYRVITQTGTYADEPVAIQIGRSLTEVDHTLSTMGLILWLVGLGGLGVAIGLGYLLGREALKPVTRLTDAAEYVAATQDLSSTIEVDSNDELGRLAGSFNSMLVALAASRAQQAQLISDAGHELRTPLTSLRTNIELLIRMPDMPSGERAELFSDVEAQLQELTTLIGDLVDLARHEETQADPIEVRLDHIVAAAIERARRRAPSLEFDIHLTPGSVKAQAPLLERAILNVLDNAVKWSPTGSVVEVWLQRGAIWTLDVHDHGPGIAAADLPYVFDRFYRADTARSMPGSGLGLAIVRQVIESHGGRVDASVPPEGGTVIHIELPIVAEDEDEATSVVESDQSIGAEPEATSAAESDRPGRAEDEATRTSKSDSDTEARPGDSAGAPPVDAEHLPGDETPDQVGPGLSAGRRSR